MSFALWSTPILKVVWLLLNILCFHCIQISDPAWEKLTAPPTNSSKFTPRNGHTTCIFKGQIWVMGGRTSMYTRYNLKQGQKMADVWKSDDGGTVVEQYPIFAYL
jgi:hypothetical protein